MTINDENVVQQLLKRNEKALYYIIDRYGGLINSIIKKYLYNLQSIQEECFDDVLLAIWDQIHSFDQNRNELKNWIAAIAKYKSIDYQRKYKKNLDERDVEFELIESPINVESQVIDNTLSSTTEKMLSYLKEEDQTLLIKHYVEEKDVAELAEEMGVKKAVIYNRLSRGRKKLRMLFARE